MKSAIAQWQRALCDPYTGEMLFWSGFIMHLARSVWVTTMFPFPHRLSQLMLLLPVVLVFLKVVFYDTYTMRELCFAIPAGIIVSVACIGSSYFGSGLWLLMILGCKGIPLKKILTVYLITAGSICLLAFSASMLGVIKNLAYEAAGYGGIRNSFGIIYCTDFAAHVFYILLALYYIAWEDLRWYHFVLTAALSGIVYYYCRTRLDCVSMLLMVLLFGIDHILRLHRGGRLRRRLFGWWKGIWELAGPWVFPVVAVVSVAMTAAYGKIAVLDGINRLISNRLQLGRKGMDEYGIHLLGQRIEMAGNGGSVDLPKNYFFLDCSYVNILLRLGIVFFVLLLFIYFMSAFNLRKDTAFLMVIALVAVNCAIAHHLMEIAYNPFACALFADVCVNWGRDFGG